MKLNKTKEKRLAIKMEEESSEYWPPELKPNIEDLMKDQMPSSSSSSFPTSGPDFLDIVEEKPFQNEATTGDYMNTSMKMDSYHDFASSRTPGIDQTSIADDVRHCSDIFSGFSHGLVGNLVEEKMHPNICPKIKMEIPGTPPSEQLVYQLQQQEPRNEILKDPFQSTHNCSLLTQPNIHSLHHQHQQHHITSQPGQLQYSQPSILSKQPYQPPFRQLSNFAEQQQSQQLRQQYDFSGQQHQSMFHQNISKLLQHPESQHIDVSELQLMQKKVGPQLNILNLEMHQHSGHILQQGGITSFEQRTQKIMQPIQFHGIEDSQKKCGVSQETMQQRLQTLATLHQHHGVGDQQKFQSQRPFTGTSSGEYANPIDWHDEAYEKLQEMRQQYGSQLEKLQKQFMYMYEKAARPEQVAYYKNNLIQNGKMIKFLSIQRSELADIEKEKFYQYQQVMLKHLSFWRRKFVSVEQQAQTFQPLGLQSQISQPHFGKLEFHSMNLALTTNLGNKSSVYSMQPGVPKSQPNMVSSLQHGSRMGLEQRNMSGPLQHSQRSTGPSVLFAQQTNFASNAVVNALDSSLNHQTMLPSNLKQPMQSKIIWEKKQQMLMQNRQMGEPPVNQHQTPLPATPCQPPVTSPQKSEHSLPLIDQKTLPFPLLKSGIQLHSSCSSLIIASPSTLLTPSSIPLYPEGHNSCVAPILKSEENRQSKTQFTLNQVDVHTQIHSQPTISELDILTGTPPSPLLMEFTSPSSTQQSSDARQPIHRLLRAVELLSPKALSASAHEIGAIVNLVDMIAGAAAVGDSRGPIGEDLVTKTRFHIQEKTFGSRHVSIHAREMKHQISIMASDALLSSPSTTDGVKLSKHKICDFDSTATSRVKRRRKEHNDDLLDEIHCINQQLFETVIDLDSYEDAASEIEDSEGIIVRCSYSALALDENFKPYASLVFPVLPLRLLVPSNYPKSSPIILDGLPVGWSYRSKESEYLSEKTKLKFSASVQNLSEPMSLEEMAKTWDACARAVLIEYAQLFGGECFSSRYGIWENYHTT